MATQPNYASTPKTTAVTISVANPNRDGSGTLGTVFTAGANGSRLEYVSIKARGATSQGIIRMFLWNGTNHFLVDEEQVQPIGPTAETPTYARIVNFAGMVLPANWQMRASTHNGETFDLVAVGSDF